MYKLYILWNKYYLYIYNKVLNIKVNIILYKIFFKKIKAFNSKDIRFKFWFLLNITISTIKVNTNFIHFFQFCFVIVLDFSQKQ